MPWDKDQLPLPVHLPCDCGCGRSILQPATRGSGRPRRYVEDSCRQTALRNRREAKARDHERRYREEQARIAAQELALAHTLIKGSADLAQFVAVWRQALQPYGQMTPAQLRAVAEVLQMQRGAMATCQRFDALVEDVMEHPERFVAHAPRNPYEYRPPSRTAHEEFEDEELEQE